MPDLDISVLMATRDRPDILERCLRAFGGLDVGEVTWELIVVNDGDDPGTEGVLDDYDSQLPLVRLQSPGGEGKNRALNVAIPEAKGGLFAFVDDDVLPARDWLTSLTRGCARWPEQDVFGGRILPDFPTDVPDYIDLEWSRMRDAFVIGDWGIPEGKCDPARIWGPNMAVRRGVFAQHRFDEGLGPRGLDYVMGGDSEFILRITAEGRDAIHLPEWTVEHVIRAEQFEPDWLKGRAFRAGRHDALVDPQPDALRLLGVPVGLFVDAAHNFLLALVHHRNRREGLKNWMWYELARGRIHQHRLMNREGRTQGGGG